jgi:hypothetical protein
MDEESAAIKIAGTMNGPPFEALESGVHDVFIKTRIRRIKEGVRSILSGLLFKVSKVIPLKSLLPTGNASGSGQVMNLSTGRVCT